MGKAILDPVSHTYKVVGDDRVDPSLELPSVSNIARLATAPFMKGLFIWAINAYISSNNIYEFEKLRHDAGVYGSYIHDILANTIKGTYEPRQESDETKQLVKVWRELMDSYGITFADAELAVYNPLSLYAGTFDAIGTVGSDFNEETIIFDWKTKNKKSPPSPNDAVQLAGYALAIEAMDSEPLPMPKPTRGVVVYLYRDTKTARWCEVDLEKAKVGFNHCLGLYKAGGYYV